MLHFKTVRRILDLLNEGHSHRDIAERCKCSKAIVSKYASGNLPKGFTEEKLKHYATSTKLCRHHRAFVPCVECEAQRYNQRHGIIPQSIPLSGIYDDRHRKACDEQKRWLEEADDFVNEGIE